MTLDCYEDNCPYFRDGCMRERCIDDEQDNSTEAGGTLDH
jgi:hypothetical protein